MTKDWTNIYKKYKGLWVALDKDETTVVSSSKDAKKAYREAVEKGVKVPILLNVPKENSFYIGGVIVLV